MSLCTLSRTKKGAEVTSCASNPSGYIFVFICPLYNFHILLTISFLRQTNDLANGQSALRFLVNYVWINCSYRLVPTLNWWKTGDSLLSSIQIFFPFYIYHVSRETWLAGSRLDYHMITSIWASLIK